MRWLAQAEGPDNPMRWVWPEESTLPLRPLLILATLVVGALAALWARRAVMGWWRRIRPLRVFWRIGGALGLSVNQRLWLWQVARGAGLESPITLLVCRATLEAHVEIVAQRRPKRDASWHRRRAAAVARLLFEPNPAR